MDANSYTVQFYFNKYSAQINKHCNKCFSNTTNLQLQLRPFGKSDQKIIIKLEQAFIVHFFCFVHTAWQPSSTYLVVHSFKHLLLCFTTETKWHNFSTKVNHLIFGWTIVLKLFCFSQFPRTLKLYSRIFKPYPTFTYWNEPQLNVYSPLSWCILSTCDLTIQSLSTFLVWEKRFTTFLKTLHKRNAGHTGLVE